MTVLLKAKLPKILLLNFGYRDHKALLDKGYNVEWGFTRTEAYGPDDSPSVSHFYPSSPYEYDIVIFNSNENAAQQLEQGWFRTTIQSDFQDVTTLSEGREEKGFVLAFVGSGDEPVECLQYAGLGKVGLHAVDPRDTMYFLQEPAEHQQLYAILEKYFESISRPIRREIYIAGRKTVPWCRRTTLLTNRKDQSLAAFLETWQPTTLSNGALASIGGFVGSVAVPKSVPAKLIAIILPQFESNIRVAVEILKYLEIARPDLFPEDEEYKWLLREEYKFDETQDIENKARQRQGAFEQEMEKLEDEKRQTYESLKYLHQTLIADDSDEFEEDEQLTPSVKKALEEIGFQVELVDQQLKKVGKRKKREDLLVREGDFVARAECKGTENQNASETYFGQAEKHLRLGPSEVNGKKVTGLLIVNHDRKREASRRDPPYCDEDGERLIATHDDLGLLWTVELYKIALAVRKGELPADEARRLIKEPGRITCPPQEA